MFNWLKPGVVTLPNFQHRIIVGGTVFVGMLLLVGWIAINEPARMDVFTNQYHGRSVENGASTFLTTCATCHGVDGKGITGKAPALNNPMLFLKENPAKVASKNVNDLTAQRDALIAQINAYNLNVAQFAQVHAALEKSPNDKDLQTKATSLSAQISNVNLAQIQEKIDALAQQINAANANLALLVAKGWDPTRDPRLVELKWGGTLQNYVESTVTSGRPVSALYFPQPMPAWGQMAGGPLRPDEVQDVTQYILNFQDGAVKLSPKDVNQQFALPSLGGAAPAGGPPINASGKPVGSGADPKALATNNNLKSGDPAAGQAKYTALGCVACHQLSPTGPNVQGTFTRVVNTRLKDPANAGKTPEEYLAESIVHPNAYVVPTYQPNIMPQNFGDKIDMKDLEDLIAFLETQK